MTLHESQQSPEQSYQSIMIVWAALLFSQFMFIAMVFFIKPEVIGFDLAKPPLGKNSTATIAFAVLSLLALAVSFAMRKNILARSVDEQNLGLVQSAIIVGCAFCESISLFGLIMAFAFEYQYFFLFSALGILGTLLHWPQRNDVHAASYKK